MSELVALALIFAVVTTLALVAFQLLRGTADDPDTAEPARAILGGATAGVGGIVPSSASGKQKIQQDLWLAGYYQPVALDNFLAVRALLVLTPIFMAIGIAAVAVGVPWSQGRLQTALDADGRTVLMCLAGGLVCAILGYAIPRVILASEAKARGEKLRRGVPTLMDTLGLCLSTGAGLKESFERSGDAIRRGHPDLAHDVRIVHRQAELRSMEHALDQWRKRTPLPEVRSLCFLLAQSDRLGTDASRGLHELSASYRVDTRQRAEASANRTNFYLLFPTVFCLLMAAGIILVGPSVVKIDNNRKRILEDIERASQQSKDVDKVYEKPVGNRPAPPATRPPQPERN